MNFHLPSLPQPADQRLAAVFRPGQTCWRMARADRVAVLAENDRYFACLAEALAQARRSILILGWQFDPRTRLTPDAGQAEARKSTIGHLLRRQVRERPELEVKLLIWQSPTPVALSQDFYPQLGRRWFDDHGQIRLVLDIPRPLGACHHQKVIVIDDRLAFCGGGDVSVDRWDNAFHDDDQPLRRRPNGTVYPARHETMLMVDGEAARALGDLARDRWQAATGETLAPVLASSASDPWPASARVDFSQTDIAIARTEPAWRGRAGVRESEALHLAAIEAARRLIYFENQYVTSPLLAAALGRRLEEADGPEVVIVTTAKSPSWFDRATMDPARSALIERLAQHDPHGRLSVWTPYSAGGRPIIVHAKVAIIDDSLLRVGSANLNNRSCGFDTECDLALVRPEGEGRIRAFRHEMLAHFIGCSPAAFAEAEAATPTVAQAIDRLNGAGRMRRLSGQAAGPLSRMMADFQLGDPFTPQDSWRPWRRRRLARLVRDQSSGPDRPKSITSGR